MKLNLTIILLFFSLLLQAQQRVTEPQKGSADPLKINSSKGLPPSDVLNNKKTMTPEELSKLGIELPGTSFTINGNIKGLKDSTQVFISDMTDGKTFAQDRAAKGRFKLHGQLEREGLYCISFIGYKDRLTLFMANDSVAVTGDAGHMETLVIKGTAMENDFVAYRHGYDAVSGKLSELLQGINTAQQRTKKDSLIREYKKIVLVNADSFLKQKPGITCIVLYIVHNIGFGG